MGRYDERPDPLCRHARRGIVTSGGGLDEGHAATNVCDRPECIADAKEWATSITRLPAEHIRDADRPAPKPPTPSLFDGA